MVNKSSANFLAINSALCVPSYGAHPVAVVSYDWWERRLGGDPAAIGKTVTIDKVHIPSSALRLQTSQA